MVRSRSAASIGPRREQGAITEQRSTTFGRPLASRKEISAPRPPSSVITSAALKAGLARIVSAAVLTAFWSRG